MITKPNKTIIATAKMMTTTFAEFARDRRFRSFAVDVLFPAGD
jgi:hypothetical protein